MLIADMADCTNISIMQLFHELKQRFPAVPDRVVSECIRQTSHDRDACVALLSRENQGYMLHSYPVALKMSTGPAERPVCEKCRTGQGRYTVNVNCNVQQQHPSPPPPPPLPPPPPPRVRSALEVQPSLPQQHWLSPPTGVGPPRSYTSVNLTLRPPSSEPQPPIDIRSDPGPGTSLTYSTSSYDPRQGFQSQLQIRIGPGGVGSVSALRTRPQSLYCAPSSPQPQSSTVTMPQRTESSPDVSLSLNTESSQDSYDDELVRRQVEAMSATAPSYTYALLVQQLERKDKLQRELRKEKEKLRAMKIEVREMKKDLEQRQRQKKSMSLPALSTLQKVQELREEIQRLQEECKKMYQEVDSIADPNVPIGETNEEFYKNIYTGQRGYVLGSQSSREPPPRPTDPERRGGDSGEGPSWRCSACTFQNHPLMEKCEQCEMPRLFLAEGEMQDIHIHVTHHNFPARLCGTTSRSLVPHFSFSLYLQATPKSSCP